MKQDEMTICECIEYLDSIVGDDKNVKDCLDYIEHKAKAMDKKLRDYKNIFGEEHSETNYEHYKDAILGNPGFSIALVGGKPCQCSDISCRECGFSTGHGCSEKIKEWLNKPYEKPKYKLTQFEFDLLNAHKDSGMQKCISNYKPLLELHEKGYFKDIDTSVPIHKILANYEIKGEENYD